MAKRWVAVEEDDDRACEPCDSIDGTTYRNREDAYRDYPGGVGFKDCIGAQYGNSCRGKVVKRRGAEPERNQGMTDARLLAEFRNRLAERERIGWHNGVKTDVDVRKTPAGDWCKIQNISADETAVHIFDEIGFWGVSASDFVDQLNGIVTPKITVHINSPGGEVFDGVAIHTALATSKAHVTTFVTGVAASAASFIAMAGDTIKMARNATMMIHDASGLVWGNAADMRQQADLLDKLSNNIADMYAMQAGGTVDQWRAAMLKESWYTGQEALAAGLVDEITDADEKEPEEQPLNRLSLAAFNFAGRAAAPEPFTPEPEKIEPGPDPYRDHGLHMLAAMLRHRAEEAHS
jgi:ATP-dependent Clp endopeptidase proteolytic subunit ClpP